MQMNKDPAIEMAWEWAKTEAAWPLARNALASRPDLAKTKHGKWAESLLHWAGLSSLGGTLDLLALGANPNERDSEGRSPLDWAVEKIYFVWAELEGDASKNPSLAKAAREAESCAFALIQAGANKSGAAAKSAQGYSLAEIAIRAGRLALAKALVPDAAYWEEQGLRPFGWWLSGEWESEEEASKALGWIAGAIGKDPGDSVFGEDRLPLGLLASQEYAKGSFPLKKLVLAHKAGARVDAIADDERDLAMVCARISGRNAGKIFDEIEAACGLL